MIEEPLLRLGQVGLHQRQTRPLLVLVVQVLLLPFQLLRLLQRLHEEHVVQDSDRKGWTHMLPSMPCMVHEHASMQRQVQVVQERL